MKKYDEQMASGAPTTIASGKRYGTLYGRAKAWFDQRSQSLRRLPRPLIHKRFISSAAASP
jgi:hypothetical protein